jgi:hypothetical protein
MSTTSLVAQANSATANHEIPTRMFPFFFDLMFKGVEPARRILDRFSHGCSASRLLRTIAKRVCGE